MKPSAAQRRIPNLYNMTPAHVAARVLRAQPTHTEAAEAENNKIVDQLLREDRQRKAMERAIVNYLKDHEDWLPIVNDKAAIALYKLARKLAQDRRG